MRAIRYFAIFAMLLVHQSPKSLAIGVDDCVDAIEARARSLRKGVFTAIHRQSIVREADRSLIVKLESHLYCAFDFDRDQFRFDRTQDTNFFRDHEFPEGIPAELKAVVKPQMVFHFIRGSLESMCAIDYGHAELSELSVEPRDAEPHLGTNPFDPRKIGLCGPYYLNSVAKSEEKLKYIFDRLKKGKSEELPDGIVKIQVTKPCVQSVWIDVNKDFVPIRMEEANPGPVVLDPKSPPLPNTFCTFDWVRVNNQWVPAAAKMEWRDEEKQEIAVDEYSFEWKQAGEPVADVLFTSEGLRMPDKTPIVDARLRATQKPFIVGQLGPSAVPPDFNVPAKTELGGGKGSRIIQVLIGLAVVAAVVGSVWYWRKRAGTRTG